MFSFKKIFNGFNFDLNKQGILGINSRNLDYILPCNSRKFYPLVDDKLETKKIAERIGVKYPKTYGIIEYQDQVQDFLEIVSEYKEFVIKPAHGSGGEGIVVINNHEGEKFYKASGALISLPSIKYHLNNILGGLYSLGGLNDKIIIEYCINPVKDFQQISYQGVPDIRVIIYKGFPVMAMLRLPTQKSDGKANLHSGGVGVGISIKNGTTTYGVQSNCFVTQHPDTRENLYGRTIPYWDEILDIASRFETAIGLGYIGVDLVIDKNYGPMMLEVNARPGISIQIANRTGLKQRLVLVDEFLKQGDKEISDKINFARTTFV